MTEDAKLCPEFPWSLDWPNAVSLEHSCGNATNTLLKYSFVSSVVHHACIIQDTKHFQNFMLVRMASESAKTTPTIVWIAQDTTESRMPRRNVHTNQILAHVNNALCVT